MTAVPPDFGGLIGYWLDQRAHLVRYGHGKPIEGIRLTPLNLLQGKKIIDDLIERGAHEGRITDEHRQQAEQLPMARGLGAVMPRDVVDDIAGPE